MKDLSSLPLSNPFWQFSLKQWQNSAIQAHLLSLQDNQNHRINLLLLAMWLGFEHKDIRSHLQRLLTESQQWHDRIVSPIRLARQAMPKTLPDLSFQLKEQLQACELQAEQIEQAILFQESIQIPVSEKTNYDSLDWLIINLSASDLGEIDLLLMIQNCLPTYPTQRISDRLRIHS